MCAGPCGIVPALPFGAMHMVGYAGCGPRLYFALVTCLMGMGMDMEMRMGMGMGAGVGMEVEMEVGMEAGGSGGGGAVGGREAGDRKETVIN